MKNIFDGYVLGLTKISKKSCFIKLNILAQIEIFVMITSQIKKTIC